MRLTRSTLQLTVDGRSVTVGGEAYVPGHGSPDFVVYSNTIKKWDDGAPIDDLDRKRILAEIVQGALDQELTIEIE